MNHRSNVRNLYCVASDEEMLQGIAQARSDGDEDRARWIAEMYWFDTHGNLERDIPDECVDECSAQGDVTEAVEHWQAKLSFFAPTRLSQYWLLEFGAWTADELNEWTPAELSQRVLWLACGQIRDDGEWIGLVY